MPRHSTTGALAVTWRSEVGIEAPVSRWFDLAETAGLITALRTCVSPQTGQAIIPLARCFSSSALYPNPPSNKWPRSQHFPSNTIILHQPPLLCCIGLHATELSPPQPSPLPN